MYIGAHFASHLCEGTKEFSDARPARRDRRTANGVIVCLFMGLFSPACAMGQSILMLYVVSQPTFVDSVVALRSDDVVLRHALDCFNFAPL